MTKEEVPVAQEIFAGDALLPHLQEEEEEETTEDGTRMIVGGKISAKESVVGNSGIQGVLDIAKKRRFFKKREDDEHFTNK